MKLELPDAFLREMEDLFRNYGRTSEWPAFLASFTEPAEGGLRANALKIDVLDLLPLLADALELPLQAFKPVPWSPDGLYLPAGTQPGRLPHYAAGLYYIQEPSAMLPANVLAARPGERILDLCAAPGGKTCRIAADLKGEGLIWANEISADRARALLRNVELTGCANCVITQETPERLAARLPEYFDRILVDAPCSGSGMFRRDPAAVQSWKAYGSAHCVNMQQSILRAAWPMLRPGGSLVYSTCTFSIAENEAMIAWLLDEYPDCRLLPIVKAPGVSDGLPLQPELSGTARIWPHLATGDGHFCALVQKLPGAGSPETQAAEISGKEAADWQSDAAWAAFCAFCQDNLSPAGIRRILDRPLAGSLRIERDCLHILPPGFQLPPALKLVKTGLFLGQIKKLRDGRQIYEPSPAFILSLAAEDLLFRAGGPPFSDLVRRYLRGETLAWPVSGPGFTPGRYAAVTLTGGTGHPAEWPLGWAKAQPPSMLKNLYPQAWRRQI